jgi:uncharacterized protein (TIGR02646 family)
MIKIHTAGIPSFFIQLVAKYRAHPSAVNRDGKSRVLLDKNVREFFRHEFNDKCGYCESPVGPTSFGGLDLFRPRSRYGIEAELDWNNYVYSCTVCNRNKGNAFPLMGENQQGEISYELALQQPPLLLNPRFDEPSEHFAYQTDGKMIGLTERGRATIERLDLNRDALRYARQREHRAFSSAGPLEKREMLLMHQPYLGMKRMFTSALDDSQKRRIEVASEEQSALDQQRDNIKADIGIGLEDYKIRPRRIESINIENIGAIHDLKLDLTAAKSSRVPCFALLGVNGVGKSTILKAIATALAGESYAKQLRIRSNTLLAHGAKSGHITLRITGYSHSFRMNLERGKPLQYDYPYAPALVLAYGSTRLVASGRHRAKPGVRHAKLANLFDPFLPMSDPSRWLDNLPENLLEPVRATLDSLLNSNQDTTPIAVTQDRTIRFCIGERTARKVAELSDGYKALIGMAVDIMDVMHQAQYDDMKDAKGIVLIDELGNHFHPEWKIRIVSALRRTFPAIQFIFSTHEPLCLRGLVDGEVAVLQQDKQGVFLLTDLPELQNLRIDQLLTSEHFGLASTLDPAENQKIQRYHFLLRNTERNEEETFELSELERELSDSRYLGGSRRERMLLQLLDLSLETPLRQPGQNVSVEKLSSRSLNRLKEILRVIDNGASGAAEVGGT